MHTWNAAKLMAVFGLGLAAVLGSPRLGSGADTRLIEAIKDRDKAAVQALLAEKVDVNVAEPDGATALHWATSRDDAEVAGLLVKAGAKVDAANDYGVTPLSLASENGSAPMIDLLLKAGANPNLALPSGETPLMTASRTGNQAAVKLLLEKAASVNATEPGAGQTALLWALSEQHAPVVQTLIEHGANVQQASSAGYTPIMMAARFGNFELTKLLLAKGAQINDVAKDGVSVLMVAVLRGHSALARFLLDQGADPTIDKAGYTALHWAAGAWESTMTHDYPTTTDEEWRYLLGVPSGKAELISALIAHGANVNARITKNPPRYGINLTIYVRLTGATPFLLAAGAADVETMKLLLAKGADPMLNTDDNVTPLMMAAGLARSSGDTLVTDEQSLAPVELCLQLGNNINAASSIGDTALHAAAYTSYPKLAQLLLERGANVNQKNKPGNTPLKLAEGYTRNAMLLYRPEVAEVLRKFGGKTE